MVFCILSVGKYALGFSASLSLSAVSMAVNIERFNDGTGRAAGRCASDVTPT
jgi:hypothetical protein